MADKIIHPELSYRVNGCIFDVHNEVGPGLREECYQKALEHRFSREGIEFLSKPHTRTELSYRGLVADVFEPDLLLPDRMIIELKHHPDGFAQDHFSQVLNYLKFWNLRLGLLVNFAMDKAIIERIPFSPAESIVQENYDSISEIIGGSDRLLFSKIRESLVAINGHIGTGYTAKTYRNLALIEFAERGLSTESDVEVKPSFGDAELPSTPISPLLVESSACVQIDVIYNHISARAVRTMQTHLRLTKSRFGLIACFNKQGLTILGIKP